MTTDQDGERNERKKATSDLNTTMKEKSSLNRSGGAREEMGLHSKSEDQGQQTAVEVRK